MEELDLKELFTMFWNKKTQILLIIAIFMAVGVIYTVGFVTPAYTSSTTLLLASTGASATGTSVTSKDAATTTTDVTLNSKLVSTYSALIKGKSILRQVISNLNVDISEAELGKNITVTQEKDTEIIRISVTNTNATTAAKVANEVAKVFTQKVTEIYKINNVQVVDQAEIESVPSNVNHLKDIILFAFVGAVIAVFYVIVANMLDTTIKSAEEVEKEFKVPVLASIPLYNFESVKGKGGKRR